MASPMTPSHVVIAYDATKDRGGHELKLTIDAVRLRGDILRAGDTIVVLGVLHRVVHPMGYQAKPYPEFFGTSFRAVEEEVTKKVDMYVNMLLESAVKCEDYGVIYSPSAKHYFINIEVKVTAGYPIKQVILQEIMACNAAWVVLDRHIRRDLRFYLKQIPCKVALIQDSLAVEVLRLHTTDDTDTIEHKTFFSLSKPVPLSISQANGIFEHQCSTFQCVQKRNKSFSRQRTSYAPILCSICGTRTEMYMKDSMTFSYSEIQIATKDFSKENLIGEGGYGHVYKGELKDGREIAAKVRKEASKQGFNEFHSEVYVLSFARHKNIVMLLGYCCKENQNILVYEYICNKSLEWHLFDDEAAVLEWHRRYAIALGTAKGLRFLHEECRGGTIVHRDMRPSNILLTHDYVPMLGDFGLAKWKTNDDPESTRILGTLGYLAPEYAENGIVSVRTDVYAFGMTLLQLISGRKIVDGKGEEQGESLRQWAEPLIHSLALHELIDRRLGDSYDTYEVYLMAKAAYVCVQESAEKRPSMGVVVRILEGENDHFHHLGEHFVPHYGK
ncbi:PREDICTED: proline-rich receptor-like protein kinase PERK13-like [Fragaria vesca subsp. vesca]